MTAELNDLSAFVAVVQAGGFRDGARARGVSASSLSEAVRRLETKLGVRLINRTTRSIAPTEAGHGWSSGSPRRLAKSRQRSTS